MAVQMTRRDVEAVTILDVKGKLADDAADVDRLVRSGTCSRSTRLNEL